MSKQKTHTFESFELESGTVLKEVVLAYRTWGTISTDCDNVIVACHSLTGDADVENWWAPLFGSGRTFDPDRNFIICVNLLGSCYGSTGPTSINPESGERYSGSFPITTIRDNVRAQRRLLDEIGITNVEAAIGSSLGGMIALEWALFDPSLKRVIAIATSGRHSAWCIGWSEAQRQAIYADPNWDNGFYSAASPPEGGLAAARMMAMLSYRTQSSFKDRFSREIVSEEQAFSVETYLRHQGKKLIERFDANSYVRLSQTCNSHDLSRGRGNYEKVLASIEQDVLVVGIDSDVLFPLAEQQELARHIPNAVLEIIDSTHGHDAFLLEADALNQIISRWLEPVPDNKPAADITLGPHQKAKTVRVHQHAH